MSPLVSVLMPVYNAEPYLGEAIRSIINQSFNDFELVICNDGSTDRSKKIIQSFDDKRIVYIENEKNIGIIGSRNKMVSIAKGDFLAVMDSDDLSSPHRLEKQVKFLKANPQYGICGSWAIKINQNNKRLGYIQMPSKNEEIRINLLFQSSFVHSSVCLRRSLLKDFFYSKEFPVAEDYDLWVHLANTTKMYNIPEYLLFYRWHHGNISKEKQLLMNEKRCQIIRRQLELFPFYSEYNLILHNSIGNFLEFSRADKEKDIKQAEKWFCELISDNKKIKQFDQVTFQYLIWYRWILYFVHFKRFRLNSFFPKFGTFYPKVLFNLSRLLFLRIKTRVFYR
jgi:glycosyltransferase involved in cell wall biosynthesis